MPVKKRRGRPSKNLAKRICIHLSKTTDAALRRRAESEKRTLKYLIEAALIKEFRIKEAA